MTGRWAAYALVVAVHLSALVVGARQVSVPTQIILMPVLMLVLWTAAPSRLRNWALVALGFSFLGDALPQFAVEEWKFPLMLGAFLCAHLAWVTAFWPLRREAAGGRALLPYLVVAVVVLAWCLPGAGPLGPALVVYALALLITACLATAFGWPGWIGGALFIVSDSLIALQSFAGVDFPGRQVVIMATYTIAHGLLALGILRSGRTA